MIKIIKKNLLSQTSKDSFYLLASALFSTVINFVIIIILTNSLETSQFGLIITGLIFIQMVTDIFELGINASTLNSLSKAPPLNRKKIIQTSWSLKLGLYVLIALGVYFCAEILSDLLFHNNSMKVIIKISAIGVLLLPLISWGQTIFQAQKNFLFSAIVSSSSNVFRLLILVVLLFSGYFATNQVFFSLQIVLVFSLLLIMLKLSLPKNITFSQSEAAKIIKFGLPIGIGFALAAFYTKLDQIMILNIVGENEAGIYGLANRLVLFFILAVAAFSSAISPRFASISFKDFHPYFLKTLLGTGVLVIVASIAILLGPFLIPLIFSDNYLSSIMPFQILMLGMIFFIISSPFMNAITFTFKKTHFSLVTSLVSLLLVYFLLSNFIPNMKSIGAALAITVVYFVQMILAIVYFKYCNKKSWKLS